MAEALDSWWLIPLLGAVATAAVVPLIVLSDLAARGGSGTPETPETRPA
jgi:hypothetical protein